MPKPPSHYQGQHLSKRARSPENVVQGTADDPVYDGTLPTIMKRDEKRRKADDFVGTDRPHSEDALEEWKGLLQVSRG